jgi:hypothetical protein
MAAESKVKIRFLTSYEVQDEKAGTPEATVYKAGATLSMVPASADHFVRKGVAEYVAKAAG